MRNLPPPTYSHDHLSLSPTHIAAVYCQVKLKENNYHESLVSIIVPVYNAADFKRMYRFSSQANIYKYRDTSR